MMGEKILADYGREADVLYIHFTHPPEAVEHDEDERGLIRNCDERGGVVGITVISASRFAKRSDRG